MEEASEHNKKQSVPVLPWMRSPIDVSLFDECPLNLLPFLDPRFEVALENMDFTPLFPVQVAVWQETIGPGSCERDLCINSPTGSGKTLAYALPIVQMLSTRAVSRLVIRPEMMPVAFLCCQPPFAPHEEVPDQVMFCGCVYMDV
ncbi:hypothetical protein HYC85_023518 [Camellia sinensis]|uniref:ATP-dependent RNA helicase n=1 Tax=Camellia sinensis TaxID=4442 RepID=A0A7J7GEU2_CAMSI|nr:hypothetical protein HYC85_023518 [Camellia sinensis]